MYLDHGSICVSALATCMVAGAAARALDLAPVTDITSIPVHQISRRSSGGAVNLLPITDPSTLKTGPSVKREANGNSCFDPMSQNNFLWGAYAGDNMYIANFTLYHPGDDQYILPIEGFAKEVKSINCGSPTDPHMKIVFNDQDTFNYARNAWDWVNKADINYFTVVTEPDQCYKGDDRSPYSVKNITFDPNGLVAMLDATEKEWAEVADEFELHVGHEYVDPSKANITHPQLVRRDSTKTMNIGHDFNKNLFTYDKDSAQTAGLALSADAHITTSGNIVADFDIKKKAKIIPTDVVINIHPQGVNALFELSLDADGTLGKKLDFALKPEIEIPVEALTIKNLLEIGPYVTMGIHVGSDKLSGTAEISAGAKATIEDSSSVKVDVKNPDQNSINGWKPHFDKVEPKFSAQIGGAVKAWSQLGIEIKVQALKWGYQASVDAQIPYFEVDFDTQANTEGVCGTQKTIGVDLDANVGIDLNLNAGEVNKAPTFSKDLYQTSWPLFSTCLAFGPDKPAKSTTLPKSSAEALSSPKATGTSQAPSMLVTTSVPKATATSGPTSTQSRSSGPIESSSSNAIETPKSPSSTSSRPNTSALASASTSSSASTNSSSNLLIYSHLSVPLITAQPTIMHSADGTASGSWGLPTTSCNSTLLTLASLRRSAPFL